MSRIRPECIPQASFSDERVCTGRINDEDVKRSIRDVSGERGRSYCGRRSAPPTPVSEGLRSSVCGWAPYYGRAVDQPPYISREGGFTEFLSDFPFRSGPIDGLRYHFATGVAVANVVLLPLRPTSPTAPLLRFMIGVSLTSGCVRPACATSIAESPHR